MSTKIGHCGTVVCLHDKTLLRNKKQRITETRSSMAASHKYVKEARHRRKRTA